MAVGNKFGWHSGTLYAKDAKLKGDLYVQDDIVFSDVSAGVLGVTGGINMAATTSAIGIDMNGGTFSTAEFRFSNGLTLGANTSTCGVVFTDNADNATTPIVHIDATPTIATAGARGGYLYISGDRATAWTSSDGNPDIGLKIRLENNTNSTTARGGVRCIDAMARNDDASAICANIHCAYLTAENTSDVSTECADMQVLQLIMSNQGIVDTTLYGLRVLENSEGTIPTDTVGIKVTTSTNAPASGTRADGIMVTTGGATGGWTDGLHIAGTLTNGINIAPTTATTGINIAGTCTTSIGIVQTVSGATQTVIDIDATPTLATDGCRGGYLYISGDRATAWTATGGNPDTGLKIRMENNTNSSTSYGGVRCIDAMARNDDASASCANIHTAYLTAENTSDVSTTCSDMEVLQLIMSNQGVVTTSLYGLRVLENSEGTVPTDTVGIKVTTSANAPAGGTRADGILVTTGGANGGWADAMHIAGTITNGINFAGTLTEGLNFNSVTLGAMFWSATTADNMVLSFGTRATEKTVALTAVTSTAYRFDPIQMNVNLTVAGTLDTDSTMNLMYYNVTHDTNAAANLRLKCSDWTIAIGANVKDVYVYQGELDFTAATTVGGEACALGLTVSTAATSAVTGNVWGAIIMTTFTSAVSVSASLFLSHRVGTLTHGVYFEPLGSTTITNLLYLNNAGTVTNFFQATTKNSGGIGNLRATPNQTATCDGSLKVVIQGTTLYIPLYNAVAIS